MEVIEKILEWQPTNSVLATVTNTWGSSPRGIGSFMGIKQSGDFCGSVSGGCVESNVIAEALNLLEEKNDIKHLKYGVSNDQAWEHGLACGGTIEVMLYRLNEESLLTFKELQKNFKEGKSSILNFNLKKIDCKIIADKNLADPENSFLVEIKPALHLFIVGAVHVAQQLIEIAKIMKWRVTLIDPRSGWLNADRFRTNEKINTVKYDDQWPDKALAGKLHKESAVVCLSHDPKLDDPAIVEAIKANVFYLGCLSSSRTHSKRVERLKQERSINLNDFNVHAPVGLDLGSRDPASIAISICAEIIQATNNKLAKS